MRIGLLLAALAMVAWGMPPAAADHNAIGIGVATLCTYTAPLEQGCAGSEQLQGQHVHWAGATPRVGISLPEDSTVTVTLTATTTAGEPYTATRTCNLGLFVHLPSPFPYVPLHRSCYIDVHTNMQGEVALTVSTGEGILGIMDAWVVQF